MIVGSRRLTLGAMGTMSAWLVAAALAGGQTAPGQKPPMAEDVFKNIQVLKGIPVD
jgi:hypothetical protein